MKKKSRRKRLHQALTGHYYDLLSTYYSSAAHKLPSGKGILREDAVARFVSTWVSKRFNVLTNVFAVAADGEEAPSEIDLVVHDAERGSSWPLDAHHTNSIVTCEHISMTVEVKSHLTEKDLNDACASMNSFLEFLGCHHIDRPLRVLFAYEVAPDLLMAMQEKFAEQSSSFYPFDAFVFLKEGAYFADSQDMRALRLGIPKGLGPDEVENDGPSVDRMTMEDCVQSKYLNGFRWVPDGTPENNLLCLAALATFATAGASSTSALLAAVIQREMTSIIPQNAGDSDTGV
ncbi:DUF6602 domain-containing protein [Luteibacter sp. UNCMF366Tsu5.1]|uniref:DUF6602 domain-containing protein n=1 Tax=Luteibacter sp. UNCMF366Tsu5.1 TaxID=1502758 RepID=UPI000908C56B|nr:DUF6602 domain-containing protein [Luteibacter sp. UNCMF366Tsu5.1]SFW24429.1 hypothetical protein SAMN02800691_0497 [Luteibacter sp. UNCMF366Tsu5.1]